MRNKNQSQPGIPLAIYHFSASFVAGAKSPVAAAAYRHRATMVDTVRGDTWSYPRHTDLVHAEINTPTHPPAWLAKVLNQPAIAEQSAALWNKVLFDEPRADGQTCRDVIIALPAEFTREQAIGAMREFVSTNLTAKGVVVDWVMHDKGDGNPHVHLTHTLRPLADTGFGPKLIPLLSEDGTPVRTPKGKIVYRHFIGGTRDELIAIRHAWAATANKHLTLAGYGVRVDASSYVDLGIAIPPTSHVSPAVAAMAREKRDSEVLAKLGIDLKNAAAVIIAKPDHLLAIVTIERSTFTQQDIARALNRFVHDPSDYVTALANVMASPELVLQRPATPEHPHAVYSTRTMIELERRMADTADSLLATPAKPIMTALVERAIAAVETKDGTRAFTFSEEQTEAVRYLAASPAIASVIGMAGAGKSTLLEAANRAWTNNGQRVVGAALSGIAAQGLQSSADIPSGTISSWIKGWEQGRDALRSGDVFVLDEAGMVSSKEMAAIVDHVQTAGAKLVLVGDPMQLQPIEAGAAFRAIAARTGSVTLSEIFRQNDAWGRTATQDFSTGKMVQALDAYDQRGHIKTPDTTDDALRMIVSDWADARVSGTTKPSDLLVLAQTNAAVRGINTAIRTLVAREGGLSDPIDVMTERGARTFAVGDRIITLKTGSLADPDTPTAPREPVFNGMLGTVTSTANGVLTVAADNGQTLKIVPGSYNSFDHGYAETIHKSQGATVQRTFVLANPMMDRHLALVAMSRHKAAATLYAPKDCFADRADLDRAFSRDRQKSTTLDYAADYASRRGLDTLSTIAPDVAKAIEAARAALAATWGRVVAAFAAQRLVRTQAPQPAASLPSAAPAAGASPSAVPAVPVQRAERAVVDTAPAPAIPPTPPPPVVKPAPSPAIAKAVADNNLRYAVNRYVNSLEPMTEAKRKGQAPLPHLAVAFDKHKAALEALRPGAIRDLASAEKHDAPSIIAMANLKGLDRAAVLVAGMEREGAVRTSPALRAERLVVQWHTLVDKHIDLRAKSDTAGMKAVSVEMRAAAKAFAADPAATAVLASRPQDFGITDTGTLGKALQSPDVGKALAIAIDPPVVVQQQSQGWSM